MVNIILTESLISIKHKSSGRLQTDHDFLKDNKIKILVINPTANFNNIIKQIDSTNDADEITLYLDIDLSLYEHIEGYESFVEKYNFNNLTDFFIETEYGHDYMFAYERSSDFSDILPGIRDELIIARRLNTGTTICKDQLGERFLEVNLNRPYELTTDDILANDWIDDNLTLYPTSLYIDTEINTCKMYFNLYDNKYGLPLADIFYTITNNKNKYTRMKSCLYISKFIDNYIIMRGIFNKIFELNTNMYQSHAVEVFDPLLVQNTRFKMDHTNELNPTKMDEYNSIIINTDNYSEIEIEQLLDRYTNNCSINHILFSFNDLIKDNS